MGSLSQAKTLGGIGSILTLLLLVPYFVGAALVIIGWVLILLAVKNISDAVKDRSIFNNTLIAAALAIIGTLVFALVVASAVLGFIGLGSLSSAGASVPPSDVVGLIAGLITGLAIAWVLGVVGSYFLWKSFKVVGEKSNVKMFGTAGLIFFIGSILTIILVGFVVTFIAQILFIVAFFSLPDNVPATTQPPQTMGSTM
jgi:uncharacterized membrane protein